MNGTIVHRSEPPHARLVPSGGSLAFESSYDAGLVAALKQRIPYTGRKWDAPSRRWLIDPRYARVAVELAQTYLGITMTIPALSASPRCNETRLVRLDYLGRAKDRGGESLAYGWADGSWSLVFPEDVLRTWFDAPRQPIQSQTLYQTLAIKQQSGPEEIRAAYRRMARQWHPDVCHEPDATEQFKRIQAAYDVLSDSLRRKKYDAGLYLEAQVAKASPLPSGVAVDRYTGEASYCPPYRCGWVLCDGTEQLGRFVVASILEWQEITDAHGRVMVTSWPRDGKTFETRWV